VEYILNKKYPLYSGIHNRVMGYIIPIEDAIFKVRMYEAKMVILDSDSIDAEFGKDMRTWDAAVLKEKQFQIIPRFNNYRDVKVIAYADIEGYRSIYIVFYYKIFVDFEMDAAKFEFDLKDKENIKPGFYIKGTPHFHLDDLGFPPEVYGWKPELDMI